MHSEESHPCKDSLFLINQLIIASFLNYFTALHHKYILFVFNPIQFVSYIDAGSALHHSAQSLFNFSLILWVEG